MSKKQKRELDRKRRSTWEISPVTRVAQADKKHYSRKCKHKNGTLGGAYSVPDSFCPCGTDKFLQIRILPVLSYPLRYPEYHFPGCSLA